jgi:predicted amidohydrolase
MRAAILQFQPVLGEVSRNVAAIEQRVREAGADLCVLPELCLSGYELRDVDQARACSQVPREGDPIVARLTELARTSATTLVGGFIERDGDRLYNAAFVVTPEGVKGVYRKVHLFGDEPRLFHPGDRGFAVFDVGEWRLGVLICFDWMFPEAARTLALAGADVLAHPSNLVLPWAQAAMVTRALENGVYVLTANRVGSDRELTFTGRSQAVDPRGRVLGQAPEAGDATVLAELDLALARDKWVASTNHRWDDRRPEHYRL